VTEDVQRIKIVEETEFVLLVFVELLIQLVILEKKEMFVMKP